MILTMTFPIRMNVSNTHSGKCIIDQINLIVMRVNNNTQGKHIVINELMHTLKEIDLNHSWKAVSTKLNKTRTGLINEHSKHPYRMTENDVEKLFEKSKEKIKIKTENNKPQLHIKTTPKQLRDFTLLKFLQLEDDNDKYLTGMGICNKENEVEWKQGVDLTVKFKQNYAVGKVIGEGAYALVRVAIYRPDNRRIAIKAYEKSKIKEVARKKTVRREIRILQSLEHPNIVKLLDVVETNNHLNIIMEYLPGVSLGAYLKQQPHHRFTEGTCRQIVRELAGALHYLHERNIAHRDIKLENIILDQKQSPKLIDFGFSTCIQQPTKLKIFCGTPSYMAPEIVQKKQYRGESADVWALGVMMFVMLVGYFPFKGSTDEELYRKINNADYPRHDISTLRQASNLILSMFITDPDQRITAEGILSHPWLCKAKETPLRSSKNDMGELRKLLSGSKQRNQSAKQEDLSKKKPIIYEGIQSKKLSKGKHSATTLNNTLNRTVKVEKTSKPHCQDKSHSNKKIKIEPKPKVLDLLRLELRKCSEQKLKCKSHRM